MRCKHVWTPWSHSSPTLKTDQLPRGLAFLVVASLLGILLLIAACGSSDKDPTPAAPGEATPVPAASPAPTETSGTPPEAVMQAARQELDTLIQLAQSELTLDTGALTEYSEDVAAVLDRIDSDPQVLQGFRKILEDALGVTFVFEDETRRIGAEPGKVAHALPLTGPFKCSATDPKYDPYAESRAWLFLRCFMDALIDVVIPISAADPILATEIPKIAVRAKITDRCINNIDRCASGNDPVLNKFQQGDYVGAHKTARELAATPTPQPTEAPTRPPTTVPTPVPTAPPTAAPTLPPAIGLEPTPVPAPGPVVSDFSGTWLGRYTGLYTHGFSICGTTIPIDGSITATLTQTGNQVTGSATLGGSDVLELTQDANGNCSITGRADEVTPIVATVSGNTLRSAPGSSVTFTMTKASENSGDGRTTGPYLDATFFLGRLR